MAKKETILRSVVCPSGRLPDWMTGPDSSSESSDDEDDGALPFWLKDSNKNYSKEKVNVNIISFARAKALAIKMINEL